METQELHRGRLIDHLQLVVKDLAASKRFYSAVFSALDIPLGGEGEDYFWADELFISSKDSPQVGGLGEDHVCWIIGLVSLDVIPPGLAQPRQ